MDLRTKLIENGVKNLRAFGWPECNKDNIMTDKVYKIAFKSMLKDNLSENIEEHNKPFAPKKIQKAILQETDKIIRQLISEIKT